MQACYACNVDIVKNWRSQVFSDLTPSLGELMPLWGKTRNSGALKN